MEFTIELTLDYNPDTQEIKVVGQKKKSTSTKTKSKVKVEETNVPTLTLLENKYCLNEAAIDLMALGDPEEEEIRLDIKYNKISGKDVPIFGTVEAFGQGTGNKLTKSKTVSFRGKANELLAAYGDTFEILPYRNGLFTLKGNMEPKEEIIDDDIIPPATNDVEIDLNDSSNEEDYNIDIDAINFNL